MGKKNSTPKINIFVTGGWGYGNIGDDAILLATLNSVHERLPDAALHLTSFNPQETKFHHSLGSIYSFHYYLDLRNWRGRLTFIRFTIWLALRLFGIRAPGLVGQGFAELLNQLENADLVLMAGGGYFNDRWRGSFLARIAEICASKAAGKPVIVYGQTVGPFASKFARILMPRVLKFVDRVAYRDVQSEQVLRSFRYPMSRAVLTADEANLISVAEKEKRIGTQSQTALPRIGVMIQKFRPYEGADGTKPFSLVADEGVYFATIVDALVSLGRDLCTDYVFLPSTTWDIDFCNSVRERVQEKLDKTFELVVDRPVAEYLECCRSVDLMLSTNMHPIILASAAGVPCVSISYFYKVDDFMDSIGLSAFVIRIDEVTESGVVDLVKLALKSKSRIGEQMLTDLEVVRSRARKNADQLVALAAASA